MSLGNPQSFNRYCYVENQPTNFVDPSGLFMYGGPPRAGCEVENGRWVCPPLEIPTGDGGTWDDPDPGFPNEDWIIGGGQIDMEKVKDALDKCLRDLFNLRLTYFSASERGKNGSMTVNSTNERRFNGNMGFGVVNDATSFNSVQIGNIGGGGEDDGVTAIGMAPSADGKGFAQYSPHTNYTANNLTNSMAILGVQIHELGHSLVMITGIQPQVPSKSRRPGGPDSGTSFEQCVFGGEVGRNGRINK